MENVSPKKQKTFMGWRDHEKKTTMKVLPWKKTGVWNKGRSSCHVFWMEGKQNNNYPKQGSAIKSTQICVCVCVSVSEWVSECVCVCVPSFQNFYFQNLYTFPSFWKDILLQAK